MNRRDSFVPPQFSHERVIFLPLLRRKEETAAKKRSVCAPFLRKNSGGLPECAEEENRRENKSHLKRVHLLGRSHGNSWAGGVLARDDDYWRTNTFLIWVIIQKTRFFGFTFGRKIVYLSTKKVRYYTYSATFRLTNCNAWNSWWRHATVITFRLYISLVLKIYSTNGLINYPFSS